MKLKLDLFAFMALLPIVLAVIALTAGAIFHFRGNREPTAVGVVETPTPSPVPTASSPTFSLPITATSPSPTPISTLSPQPHEPYISEYGRMIAMEFLKTYKDAFTLENHPFTAGQTLLDVTIRFQLFDFNGDGIPEILIYFIHYYADTGRVSNRVSQPPSSLFMYIYGEYQLISKRPFMRFYTNNYGQKFMVSHGLLYNSLYYMNINPNGLEFEAVSDERIEYWLATTWRIAHRTFFVQFSPSIDGQWLLPIYSAYTLENSIRSYLTPYMALPTPSLWATSLPEPHISEYGLKIAMEFLESYMREFIAENPPVFVWLEAHQMYFMQHDVPQFALYDFTRTGVPAILIYFSDYNSGFTLPPSHLFLYINGEYRHIGEFSYMRFYFDSYGQRFMASYSFPYETLYYMNVSDNGVEFDAVAEELVSWNQVPSQIPVRVPSLYGQRLYGVHRINFLARGIEDYLVYKLNN